MVDPVPEAIQFFDQLGKLLPYFFDQMPQQLFEGGYYLRVATIGGWLLLEGGYYWRVTLCVCLFVCLFFFACLFVCFGNSQISTMAG